MPDGSDTMIARLRAALDETERIARAATAGPWDTTGPDTIAQWGIYDRDWRVAEVVAYDHDNALGQSRGPGYIDPDANAAHIAHFNPDWVLRQVAAHRKILELHEIEIIEPSTSSLGWPMWPNHGWVCSVCSERIDGDRVFDDGVACPTLLALIEAYGLTEETTHVR